MDGYDLYRDELSNRIDQKMLKYEGLKTEDRIVLGLDALALLVAIDSLVGLAEKQMEKNELLVLSKVVQLDVLSLSVQTILNHPLCLQILLVSQEVCHKNAQRFYDVFLRRSLCAFEKSVAHFVVLSISGERRLCEQRSVNEGST